MERRRTEILHYNVGRSDKVYIVEHLTHEDTHYVYASYGKRTQKNLIRQLKTTTPFEYVANEMFKSLTRKKTREGYEPVANGANIDIPGFASLIAQGEMVGMPLPKAAAHCKIVLPVEHRRLIL